MPCGTTRTTIAALAVLLAAGCGDATAPHNAADNANEMSPYAAVVACETYVYKRLGAEAAATAEFPTAPNRIVTTAGGYRVESHVDTDIGFGPNRVEYTCTTRLGGEGWRVTDAYLGHDPDGGIRLPDEPRHRGLNGHASMQGAYGYQNPSSPEPSQPWL